METYRIKISAKERQDFSNSLKDLPYEELLRLEIQANRYAKGFFGLEAKTFAKMNLRQIAKEKHTRQFGEKQ